MAGPEPWIERVLREAAEAGAFEELPGSGAPIADIDKPYDPAWWARNWLEREQARDRAFDLTAEVRRALPTILADRGAARLRLEALNAAIDAVNERLPAAERVSRLDIDRLLDARHDA